MPNSLKRFEHITRNAHRFSQREELPEVQLHPFDRRNIHPLFPPKVKRLFDDGHYAQATFEAFKFVDKKIQHHSKLHESGFKLMMAAFDEAKPLVQLTAVKESSEIDEQKGFRFLFAGGVLAIRNPRGHEVDIRDDPDTCLDHLAFASLLIRRLEQSDFD
ncbi:MAG: TIGR02391 family protein [Nitrospirales bacterium]|nr:TIGR02391 family protein [Nitrospirales bacterium]